MVKEKAYAKVNLFLNILDKLDDGYHSLETVMAPLKLHDHLTFKKQKKDQIILTTSIDITATPEDNLVFKIAQYLKEQFLIKQGVIIHIDKQIPIGAGLGGGSADAAATLRGLNKLWKLKLSIEELAQIGKAFGADIPYCLYNKVCIARGIGDELVFLNKRLNFPVLLVYPNLHMSTKKVYEALDLKSIKPKKITRMTEAVYNRNFDLLTRELYNILEVPAFKITPKIKEIKQQIMNWGVDGVLMSGSGSTLFVMTKNKNKLEDISKMLDDNFIKVITKIK